MKYCSEFLMCVIFHSRARTKHMSWKISISVKSSAIDVNFFVCCRWETIAKKKQHRKVTKFIFLSGKYFVSFITSNNKLSITFLSAERGWENGKVYEPFWRKVLPCVQTKNHLICLTRAEKAKYFQATTHAAPFKFSAALNVNWQIFFS